MHKYSSLETRMSNCKERIKQETKMQKQKIIMMRQRKVSHIPPMQLEEIERQEVFKKQENQLKDSIKSLVHTLGIFLFVILFLVCKRNRNLNEITKANTVKKSKDREKSILDRRRITTIGNGHKTVIYQNLEGGILNKIDLMAVEAKNHMEVTRRKSSSKNQSRYSSNSLRPCLSHVSRNNSNNLNNQNARDL
jgi:hypothetical protein